MAFSRAWKAMSVRAAETRGGSYMEIVSEKQGAVVVFKLKGRLDAVTAPGFEQRCLHWLEAGESRFAVDLGEVEYISSAGIRSILNIADMLKAKDGGLALSRTSGMVEKVLQIADIPAMFPLYPTLEEAVAHLTP